MLLFPASGIHISDQMNAIETQCIKHFCLSQIYAGYLEADVLSFAVAVEPEHEVLGVLREVLQVLDDPVLLRGLLHRLLHLRGEELVILFST